MATNWRRSIALALGSVLLVSSAHAQTSDWRAVQNLKPKTFIFVKAQRRYLCFFEAATEDELSCETPQRRRLNIPKQEVREIRLEHSQAKQGWIGAGIGAGAGAAVGAGAAKSAKGANAFFGALGGALVGGVVGSAVPIFRRGKVIYKK